MCFEYIIDEIKVKYRLSNIDNFKDFVYCVDCLSILMNSLWEIYINNLKKADCEKSLLSLINDGLPINFRDSYIENNKEIYEFYYNDQVHSAKLTGSLDFYQRNELYNKLNDIFSKNGDCTDDFDYIENIDKLLKEYDL